MPSLADVAPENISQLLIPQRIRVFQLVHIALAGGLMIFLVMLLFFYGLGSDMDRSEANPAAMDALSNAVLAIAVICLVVGEIIYRTYFSAKRLAHYAAEPMRDRGRVIDDPAEKSMRILSQATLMRATIFNVPGFFGVVVCMVGMLQGVIFVHPIYLLNAVPAFLQLAFLAITYPTRDKLLALLRRRIGIGK